MIAPPIGYPIAYPMVNPIGFGSPDPDPDTRSRFRVTFDRLFNHPFPQRHLSDGALTERWGWE